MIYFIVNPASKSGKGQELWQDITKILNEKFPNVKYHGFISETAQGIDTVFENLKSKTDIEKIVLVGGDGTINEALNCFELLPEPPLVACLPCGTSNDFIRSMGLPNNLEEGLNLALSDAKASEIDVCRAYNNDFSRMFVNGLGCGYDGQIIHYTEKSKLKLFLNKIGISKLMYIVYGIKQVVSCKAFSVSITHDEQSTKIDNCYMLSVMINPFEGGGIYFAPKARSNDGLSDIVLIHSKKRLQFIYSVLQALLKKPATGKAYTDIQFKNAKIIFYKAQLAQIDGERLGLIKEINYQTLPKYFKLIKNT